MSKRSVPADVPSDPRVVAAQEKLAALRGVKADLEAELRKPQPDVIAEAAAKMFSQAGSSAAAVAVTVEKQDRQALLDTAAATDQAIALAGNALQEARLQASREIAAAAAEEQALLTTKIGEAAGSLVELLDQEEADYQKLRSRGVLTTALTPTKNAACPNLRPTLVAVAGACANLKRSA